MIIGLPVTFCSLARAVCPETLLIESWEGTEGAVQDASVHGLAGMRPSASTPTGRPQGRSERLGMSGQDKRDAQKRPCPRLLQQLRSLSCSSLLTSTTLTVILGQGILPHRGQESNAGGLDANEGRGHKHGALNSVR